MNIKLVDIARQNKELKSQLLPVVERVIDEAEFIMGDRLISFEKQLAKYCNKKFAIGLNSGTDGLKLALLAYGVQRGDEVITAPNGYFSDAMVVTDIGAIPVFVDINPDTYTIDIDKLKKAITAKTKAIIPVHMFGHPVDMDPILSLAKERGIAVVEDVCQAQGACYRGKILPVGETGVFSFYPGKNLGCFGDGGAVVTDNEKIADVLKYLRNDGSKVKYVHEMIAYKSRLDSLQAEILSVKLPYLDEWNKKRHRHAEKLTILLKEISGITTPVESKNVSHVYHLYVIESDKRDQLQLYLQKKGIETGVHYPTPIHLQLPYREKGFKEGDFPVTEEKAGRMLSLPMFPELTDDEIIYIAESIKNFYSAV